VESLRQSRRLAGGSQSSAVSGSLGLAFAPTHADDAGGLLAAADRAMYMAKALGGCCWCAAQPAV
jgi:predicted signal transduction protein with EAL and GGDEF domain